MKSGLMRTVRLGISSLLLHKLRSILTTLGVLFGVSSVIAMLAIGEGASKHAQELIRELGSQNVILRSVKPPEDLVSGSQQTRILATPGWGEHFPSYSPDGRFVAYISQLNSGGLARIRWALIGNSNQTGPVSSPTDIFAVSWGL